MPAASDGRMTPDMRDRLRDWLSAYESDVPADNHPALEPETATTTYQKERAYPREAAAVDGGMRAAVFACECAIVGVLVLCLLLLCVLDSIFS